MAEYLIRLEDGVKLSDICDIEDYGCVWINHHYANGLGETTPDTMAIELKPHGDLKDVNTIRQLLVEASKHGGIREDFYAEAMQIIDDAPTVVEASK